MPWQAQEGEHLTNGRKEYGCGQCLCRQAGILPSRLGREYLVALLGAKFAAQKLVHGRQGLSGDCNVAHGVGVTEAWWGCLWRLSHAAVLGGIWRSFHSGAVCYLAGALVGCALGCVGRVRHALVCTSGGRGLVLLWGAVWLEVGQERNQPKCSEIWCRR